MYEIKTDHFLLRMVYFLMSLVVAALGISFIFKGNIGVDPANVLIEGLYKSFGLSLGFWITCLWLVFIVLSLGLGFKPYIATLIDLICFGPLVDLMMGLNPAPAPTSLLMSLGYMSLGMVILAFAVGVYINSKLGAGPTMLFTFALAHRFKGSIGLVKTICDLLMLVLGYWLGGSVGIGTLVLALGIGYLFQFFIKWVKLPIQP